MATGSRRTQAEALDAIAEQLRIANHIEVLRLGSQALDDAVITEKTSAESARRQGRLNRVRAGIRVGLGIEEGTDA